MQPMQANSQKYLSLWTTCINIINKLFCIKLIRSWHNCFLLLLVQTEITYEVPDVLKNETDSVTFRCEAIGEPVPAISWYFNGIMINISGAHKYTVSNLLNRTVVTNLFTIIQVQSSDVGTYTCFAENIIGSDQSSGVLTVNGT